MTSVLCAFLSDQRIPILYYIIVVTKIALINGIAYNKSEWYITGKISISSKIAYLVTQDRSKTSR